MTFKAEDFDRFLSEASVRPNLVLMHPDAAFSKIALKRIPKPIRRLAKFALRLWRNKYIYWISLPIYWEDGIFFIAGISPSSAELVCPEDLL